jgi:hypothetical protein
MSDHDTTPGAPETEAMAKTLFEVSNRPLAFFEDYVVNAEFMSMAEAVIASDWFVLVLAEARAAALEQAAAEMDRAQRIAKTKKKDVSLADEAWWRRTPLSDDGLFDCRPLLSGWLRGLATSTWIRTAAQEGVLHDRRFAPNCRVPWNGDGVDTQSPNCWCPQDHRPDESEDA